jgi:hypothetical protein
VSNQVYANGMEVSCKAASGKSACAFPDVCFTPPQTPATPPGVPIPYPNTGMASDCADGSRTVVISGQEVMLKNKSYFKKSTGDEAGNAPKKGVVTSQNTGKVYFTSWSMDVTIEGESVVRHLDMTTHNHGSVPGNTGPWPYVDEAALPGITAKCKADMDKDETACKDKDPCVDQECQKARKCMLVPYKDSKVEKGCCPGQTPHHLVEVHCFTPVAGRSAGGVLDGLTGYSAKSAPCVCVNGRRNTLEHGQFHTIQQRLEVACRNDPSSKIVPGGWEEKGLMGAGGVRGPAESCWKYSDARDCGVVAMWMVFPQCDTACVRAQLDAYHKQAAPDGPGVTESSPMRTDMRNGIENMGGPISSGQQKFLNELAEHIEPTETA